MNEDFNNPQNDEQKPKRKKFNLFDWYYNREGKEQDIDDLKIMENPSFVNFFKLTWRKLGKLMSANLLFIFGNFPVFFALFAMAGFFTPQSIAPEYQSFAPLSGALMFENSPVTSVLASIYCINRSIIPITPLRLVFFGLTLLVFFTWGFTKVGTTYIYRNLMMGEAVFPVSDFLYVIKKNIRQSLIIGIIDMIFICTFSYSLYFLLMNYNVSQMNSLMFFFTLMIIIVYSFIRPYAYIMIFTFDLKITQIIKHSLYFVILGIKRNIVGLFGSLFLVIFNLGIFSIFIPLGLVLPFVITIAIHDFIGVYVAFPNIDKYMIDHSQIYSEENE